jgi:hypothetical protein
VGEEPAQEGHHEKGDFTVNKRFFMGDRGFIPTGRPVRLGAKPKRALGKIEEYGLSQQITLFVGQDKGKQPKNRTASCARKPAKFSPAAIDHEFLTLRGLQVGRPHVNATRTSGRGFFQGRPENSMAFEVAFIPTTDEPTFDVFKRNMDRLAEHIGERFCQDSVLIIRDDGTKRSVASAEWEAPPKRGRR